MKKINKKTGWLLIIVFLVLIAISGFIYSETAKGAVEELVTAERAELSEINLQIVERLSKTGDTVFWGKIIGEYNGVAVAVFDSRHRTVVSTENKGWTVFDARIQTDFDFRGERYTVRSTKNLSNKPSASRHPVLMLIFSQLVIISALMTVGGMLIYRMTIQPYKGFYRYIEEYEKTGVLPEGEFEGYIGKVYERFALLTRNLENQKKNKQRIIASISHDIKTPLTSIMGYTERLKRDDIPPEKRERYLQTVYDKAVQIRELVNEFDEFLSYEIKGPAEVRAVSAQDIALLLEREYSDDLESLGIGFEVENLADGAFARADMKKLNRIFGNIIGNSIKHFKTDEKKIAVRITREKNTVTVKIGDSGEGVPDGQAELIFEPFYTSDSARKVAGLGLSICREAVESLGGKIYAEKSELGGLAVSVELLCEKPPEA